ncbi:MAG: hypothetical protein NTW86_27330 [Candidatus Sumerlaeota bacterium]|nr:hypothetical protein [Candidatus Sumerlaeota bacterium]
MAVWGWGGEFAPEAMGRGLERVAALGFGGAVLAARTASAARRFLGPEWMDLARAAEKEAGRIGLELWIEAPLADPDGGQLFSAFRPSAFLIADSGAATAVDPAARARPALAAYRRGESGAMTRLAQGDDPSTSRQDAELVLRVLPGPGPDFLEPSEVERYIREILEPHARALGGGQAFRGFFLGRPLWPRHGEPWSARLARSCAGLDPGELVDKLPELFGEAAGGDRVFSHRWRRATAATMRRAFAEPLLEWAGRRGLAIVGPPEDPGDGFPSWVFGAAGAGRAIFVAAGAGPNAAAMASRLKSTAETYALLSAGEEMTRACCLDAFRLSAVGALLGSGARAVLDWLPLGEELGHPGRQAAPLTQLLPGLHGLPELNLRLTTLTSVGRGSRRRPAILVISPRTSRWRLARPAGKAAASGAGRKEPAESARLDSFLSRLDSRLRADGFDYDLWDEQPMPSPPLAAGGYLRLGDSAYHTVILPGLLNLETPTWHCLADFTAGGGKALALERHPTFLDGAADERLTEWARMDVERYATLEELVGRLEELAERPTRAISLARGSEPWALEVLRLDGEPGRAWIVAQNPEPAAGARGLIEVAARADEFMDEVDLDTGNLKPAPESVRLESILSLDVELAPGETRVFRLQKAPLAETDRQFGEASVLFAEMCLGAGWRIGRLSENLFPLARFYCRLPGLPWLGPEDAADLAELIRRQPALAGLEGEGEICLRATVEIAQCPPVGVGDSLGLALLHSPRAPLVGVALNGEEADLGLSAAAALPGLVRLSLPLSARPGENVLEIRLRWRAEDWAPGGAPLPWVLSGRFGAVPRGGWAKSADGRLSSLGEWALLACAGKAERLTEFVDHEMNVDRGIQGFEANGTMHRTAWTEWSRWPLMGRETWLHEMGFPFFGGEIEATAEFRMPEPGPSLGLWRQAVFHLGRARAAWTRLEINGRDAGGLGLSPFRRDITHLVRIGERNRVTLRAWVPWLNALAPFRPSDRLERPTAICSHGFGETPRILLYG